MLHETLEELFRTVFSDDTLKLTNGTTADDIPGWDSVATISLMFGIEQAFGVHFPGNKFAEFKNVGELKKYLASATEGHAA